MSITATLEAAHTFLHSVKGGTIQFAGTNAVAAFSGAGSIGALITDGGQTVNFGLRVTVKKSDMPTRPQRGAQGTWTPATGSNRAIKLDQIEDTDALYILTLIDPRG